MPSYYHYIKHNLINCVPKSHFQVGPTPLSKIASYPLLENTLIIVIYCKLGDNIKFKKMFFLCDLSVFCCNNYHRENIYDICHGANPLFLIGVYKNHDVRRTVLLR